MKWLTFGLWLLLFAAHAGAQELMVGFGPNRPPYVFEREERGLEYEIVVAAARAAGFTVKPYYAPMERTHRAFTRGELDVITTTNLTDATALYYSQPYIDYQNVAVSLAERHYQIGSIADLAGYSVHAFQRARFLLGDEFRRMADSNPAYFEESQQVTRNRLLYSGRVDVVIGDRRLLRYFNREVYQQVDVKQAVTEFSIFPKTSYHLGTRDEALRDKLDKGLDAIRASGEYAAIERRYAVY